jgi:peptidoglycan-associated lipoprotein
MKAIVGVVVPLAALLIALTGCPDKKPKYPSCNGDKDCKEGELCVDKKCVQCKQDSDCKEGEECKANACVKKDGWCDSDDDCPDHKACKNNACVACESDADCQAGTCTDGACLEPGECVKDEDCADDEDCIDGRCKAFTLGGDKPDIDCDLATVYFEFDSATISAANRSALDEAAQCLAKTDRSIYIIGHTDPRGTDEYNIALSDGRARAVADYLAALGTDPARFQIVPKGEADAAGTGEDSYSQDRKVEFEWK